MLYREASGQYAGFSYWKHICWILMLTNCWHSYRNELCASHCRPECMHRFCVMDGYPISFCFSTRLLFVLVFVFCLCKLLLLMLSLFKVLVGNPDLVFRNRFITFKRWYTTVAFIFVCHIHFTWLSTTRHYVVALW